jgi:hypothetical protein
MAIDHLSVVSVPVSDQAPWGRFATFEDPDGNGWVLQASTPAPRA